MSKSIVRRTLAGVAAGGVLAATGLFWAGQARADGVISDAEYAYIQAYGATAVCPVISAFPSEAGVMGVMQGIADDGFTYDAAVDIINASVSEFCPRHWSLLQRIGAEARGETGSAFAA